MSTQVGDVAILPAKWADNFDELINSLVDVARTDWDSFETSWNFRAFPLLHSGSSAPLSDVVAEHLRRWQELSQQQQELETKSNDLVAALYGVGGEIQTEVEMESVSLARNVAFAHGPGLSECDYLEWANRDIAEELISYAVGCIFGRYSLDEPGLILADQRRDVAGLPRESSDADFHAGLG